MAMENLTLCSGPENCDLIGVCNPLITVPVKDSSTLYLVLGHRTLLSMGTLVTFFFSAFTVGRSAQLV